MMSAGGQTDQAVQADQTARTGQTAQADQAARPDAGAEGPEAGAMTGVFPDGAVALVTGGSRGIGAAAALALARAGCQLAVSYRTRADRAEEVASRVRRLGRECAVIRADVTDEAQVTALFREVRERFGRLDAAVLNSGITADGHAATMGLDRWGRVLETNLTGTFCCLREALRAMHATGGSIVVTSSTSGVAGRPGQVNYAASKGGLIAMAKSAALEAAGRGVRVNCVAPGFIETDMVRGVPRRLLDQARGQIPLGRLGRPEEVANAIVFLASPLSSYITGKVLTVDGGMING